MEIVVLSIHLLVCICLIGLVLLQRSEGGALGMGGGGGSLMSGRGAADALARMTSVAGAFFLVTSLGLTFLSGAAASDNGRSVLDAAPIERPATAPAPVPTEPARPDPTESSLPAETQLASIGPPEAAAAPPAVAPAPSAATTRAGPIERPTQTSSAPQRSTAATTPRTQPAASQPTSTQSSTHRPATTIRSTGATTPATIPGQRTGAVNGVNLNEPAQPESVDVGNGLEAVRRERAGPDQ
jgi:preprotein translocase subunit SecG